MVSINGEIFNNEEFYNGEVIFKKTSVVNKELNTIEMYFKDNRDITNLMFARQWLASAEPSAKCELVMKYCPYERMDREINEQLFSMQYFAEIIAKFNFNAVYILDPHSEVCIEQFENNGVEVHIIDLEGYVRDVIRKFSPDYICYPDKGAHTKYSKVLRHIDIPYFYGQKKRDLENRGNIVDYELVNAPDLHNKKVLIIDDICCLGGTAYNAAKVMKNLGAKEVALYISHCENGIYAGRVLKSEIMYKTRKEVVQDADGEQRTYTTDIPVGRGYCIDKVYTANTMNIEIDERMIEVVEG